MVKKDIGFILKRYNFRETSLIATIYTERFGKIRGILKGFYTNKREFSSSLDIFSLNEFLFYPKKSEIWLVSHVDMISGYSYLGSDLEKAKIAGQIFNFVDKVTQIWDSNPYVFNLLRNCLNLLENDKESMVFYVFLIKFLTLSGFKPELNHCISCQRVLEKENTFSVSKGGFVCPGCRSQVRDVRILSHQASRCISYIQNSEFTMVNRLQIPVKCQEEILSILRSFTAYHFDTDCLSKWAKPVYERVEVH
ncbi:MAG: DNA repair protein RecO [Candidatus Omnitrophica bacterium]|nr:DNA repair protein RecO [Candidatus Omnitrophota bacterium]